MSETILEVKNLSYIYSKGTPFERKALDRVDLRVEAGEFLAIIGHTGSGKSTLIQHLNGLLRPTEGEVLFHGKNIFSKDVNLRDIRFRVGLVFQYPEYQLFEETVGLDIAYGPVNMGLPHAEIDRRVAEAMQAVGLPAGLREKSPFELSGGQKRRVALAGILAMEPEVLVLDEPTAGLDPQGRREMFDLIRRLHGVRGTTVILVTHSMEDAARIADRLVVMRSGGILLTGKPEAVFAQADMLESAGLSVPQVTKILLALKKRGFAVDTGCYTVEQAAEQLLKYRAEVTSC